MAVKTNARSKRTTLEEIEQASNSHTGADGFGPELLIGDNPRGANRRVMEIQRTRILMAMVEVSVEHGAANVSVAHVVQRAGVSRRTFYELFTDREDCFLAAFDEGLSRASRHVFDSQDPCANWVERVRGSLIALLSFLDAERGMGQLLVVGSLGAGHNVLQRRRRCIDQMIAVVDEGRSESKAGSELPPLTAEGIVGGVLSVLHTRLAEDGHESLLELAGPLMSLIVMPYLGPVAARKELARSAPRSSSQPPVAAPDPLRELGTRLTYRTVRVLLAVAAAPGGSNRHIADGSGITDQGQISKLLARLHGLGLIENTGAGSVRGAPNSWVLTDRGWEVQGALVRNSA
jgi:AcrR family transcriptional regulator